MDTEIPVEVKDLRIFLQNELEERKLRNPSYSLRAFAKFLEIDGSRLLKILRAERPINIELIRNFGEKLKLSPENIKKLEYNFALSKDPALFEEYVTKEEYAFIQEEIFKVISDWRHYAVLESMKLDGFNNDINWVAGRLNLKTKKANEIVERLEKVGLLVIDENGKWHDITGGFSSHIIGPEYTSKAHKDYQQELLMLSHRSVDETPFEYRDNSSMMMATSKEKIAEAKELIKHFRRKLCEFLEDSEEKDEVYQLGICLFPLGDKKE